MTNKPVKVFNKHYTNAPKYTPKPYYNDYTPSNSARYTSNSKKYSNPKDYYDQVLSTDTKPKYNHKSSSKPIKTKSNTKPIVTTPKGFTDLSINRAYEYKVVKEPTIDKSTKKFHLGDLKSVAGEIASNLKSIRRDASKKSITVEKDLKIERYNSIEYCPSKLKETTNTNKNEIINNSIEPNTTNIQSNGTQIPCIYFYNHRYFLSEFRSTTYV